MVFMGFLNPPKTTGRSIKPRSYPPKCPNPCHIVAQGVWSVRLGKLFSQSLKIIWAKIGYEAVATDKGDKSFPRHLALFPMLGHQFPILDKRFSAFEELVDQGVHCQAVPSGPWLPTGQKAIFLVKPLVRGPLGVIPRAKIPRGAPHLLCPTARGMGVQRKVLVRLVGFRYALSHGLHFHHRLHQGVKGSCGRQNGNHHFQPREI